MRAIILVTLFLLLSSISMAAVAQEPLALMDDNSPSTQTQIVEKLDPTQLILETINSVTDVLKNQELAGEEKAKERRKLLLSIILEEVDMDNIAKSTLGVYWKKFSVEELKEFKILFSQLVFTSYIRHLENYSGEEVLVLGVKKARNRKGRVRVMTKVISGDTEIPIDYSMIDNGESWAMYDLRVEGISMVKNYRVQFKEILRKKSPEKLLNKMKKMVQKNEKSA